MAKFVITFRYIVLVSLFFLLSGCLGGTIAQQIARSIATSVADKAVARAMDVDEDQAQSNRDTFNVARQESAIQPVAVIPGVATKGAAAKPENVEIDDYTYALATFSFAPVKVIAEPLPEENIEIETRATIIQGNQLVRVELFNLLIGEEKNAVYEQARLMGSTSLPQKREWQNWNVGNGQIKSATTTANQKDKKIITFLIPPEFGKLPSGAVAVVELGNPGEPNIARYKAHEETIAFKATTNR